jgi:hypothetical protein
MPDVTDLIATAGTTTVTTLATLEPPALGLRTHFDAMPDLTDLIASAATTVTMSVTPPYIGPSPPTCPYVLRLVFLKRVTFKLSCLSQLKT